LQIRGILRENFCGNNKNFAKKKNFRENENFRETTFRENQFFRLRPHLYDGGENLNYYMTPLPHIFPYKEGGAENQYY
jgi:hypothetical protein